MSILTWQGNFLQRQDQMICSESYKLFGFWNPYPDKHVHPTLTFSSELVVSTLSIYLKKYQINKKVFTSVKLA